MDAQTPLENFFRLTTVQKAALEKLGLKTAADILLYLPQRYSERLPEKKIGAVAAGDKVTVTGRVLHSKTSRAWRKKIPLGELTIADETGRLKAIWFHQPYLAKKAAVGQLVRLSGKAAARKGELYLPNPEIEVLGGWAEPSSEENYLLAVYSETRGLSSNWFHHAARRLFSRGLHQTLADPLPAAILEKYHLPTLKTALVWVHLPRNEKDAKAARKRFAFEEVFRIQLDRLRNKVKYQSHTPFLIKADEEAVADFSANFPFPLTRAQEKAIGQILKDLRGSKPMMRLLEGDVGSGKTAVAATTAWAATEAGFEVAYLAPTEILARQHFESFIQYFRSRGVQIGLLTGTEGRKFPSKINPSGHTHISKNQLLKWVANGEIPILVGTHALIEKRVKFKNLAYIVIDEQHRFGVMQRAELVRKEKRVPHLLSMTATPIPRTLALTIYGDLDLTLLDEMPPGRRPIITKIVSEGGRESAYDAIREELKSGRQCYVICPRIEEPDPQKALALQAKSAKAEQRRLQEKIFPEFKIGLLHSKLRPKEKEKTMADFARGELQILVATSMVEVGVNIPNTTIIVIEGAERFGLAQLHQLRGRVLRSSHQAYCYLFSGTRGGRSSLRLKALLQAKNGFELAEADLKLRGPGALIGNKQWGISDIGMEALKNLKMVEAARAEAQTILQLDPELNDYPLLRARLQPQTEIHFE